MKIFWCFNCEKTVQSVENIKCEVCLCEAIEQITQQNHPQQYQPYVTQQNIQNSMNQIQTSQSRSQLNESMNNNLFGMNMISMFSQLIGDEGPLMIRYTVHRPVYRIILFGDQEQEKNPVDAEKINQFQKINMKEQCAICQQKQGNGLKLPCKHQFHQNCIKPWFQNTNTCPCCRIKV